MIVQCGTTCRCKPRIGKQDQPKRESVVVIEVPKNNLPIVGCRERLSPQIVCSLRLGVGHGLQSLSRRRGGRLHYRFYIRSNQWVNVIPLLAVTEVQHEVGIKEASEPRYRFWRRVQKAGVPSLRDFAQPDGVVIRNWEECAAYFS